MENQLTLNNNIALIGWGVKTGRATFFHSPNIDPNGMEIQSMLGDVRSLLSFRFANQLFYSLNVNTTYKTYTIYKTTHSSAWGDNRVNSYVALSLLVPLNVKFEKGVLVVLNKVLEIYHKQYIDDNLRITLKAKEDLSLFVSAINSFQSRLMLYPRIPLNDVKKVNAFINYRNEEELASYFENPFLDAYDGFKKVFYLSEERKIVVDTAHVHLLNILPQKLSFEIEFKLKDGEKRVEIERPYNLLINGKKIEKDSAISAKELEQSTKISVVVNKNGYETIQEEFNLVDFNTKFNNRIYEIALYPKKYAIEFFIHDFANRGISKVKIKVIKNKGTSAIEEFKTDKSGKLFIRDLRIKNSLEVVVTKKGFESYTKKYTLSSGETANPIRINIGLKTLKDKVQEKALVVSQPSKIISREEKAIYYENKAESKHTIAAEKSSNGKSQNYIYRLVAISMLIIVTFVYAFNSYQQKQEELRLEMERQLEEERELKERLEREAALKEEARLNLIKFSAKEDIRNYKATEIEDTLKLVKNFNFEKGVEDSIVNRLISLREIRRLVYNYDNRKDSNHIIEKKIKIEQNKKRYANLTFEQKKWVTSFLQKIIKSKEAYGKLEIQNYASKFDDIRKYSLVKLTNMLRQAKRNGDEKLENQLTSLIKIRRLFFKHDKHEISRSQAMREFKEIELEYLTKRQQNWLRYFKKRLTLF